MIEFLDNNTTNIIKILKDDPIISKVIITIVVTLVLSLFEKFRNLLKIIFNKLLDFFKKESYEVIDLRKHVTICKNGHLIVLQDFRLKINKPDTTEKFHRLIDVSDGADSCKLPSLATMEKSSKEKRFTNYGFWYKSNPENIIEKVKEENIHGSMRKREEFYFKFNKKELKKINSKIIKIMYGFSIKKGQPLTNGKFDYNLISDKDRKAIIKTAFKVQYKMNKIEYIVSFIDNLLIDEENISMLYYPKGLDYEDLKDKIKYQKKDDLFYNKLICTIKKPKIGSVIKIEIPIKEIAR